MLIGIWVDERSFLPDADIKRLTEFGHEIRNQFSKPLGSYLDKEIFSQSA